MSTGHRGTPKSAAELTRMLGEGEVVTYGDIAEQAGFPKRARLVGHILATSDDDLPWWRVVNAAGRLVPGHERDQAQLLRAEGVRRVHLEVRGSNAVARALYASLGFCESRRRVGYYRDGEDALELGVAL